VTDTVTPQITDQGANCLLELLTHHNTFLSAITLVVCISIIIIEDTERAEHHHSSFSSLSFIINELNVLV
jgi:hypothetical protein